MINQGETEMRIWSSRWLQLYKESRKKIGTWTGFEPMASALALQYSTNWAMKTHTLGAGKFVEFMLTRERNET